MFLFDVDQVGIGKLGWRPTSGESCQKIIDILIGLFEFIAKGQSILSLIDKNVSSGPKKNCIKFIFNFRSK